MNKDYASLTNVNALKELATGQGAQYPMITTVISNVVQSNPDQVNDIGYFAMPTESGDPHATVWEANGAYIPKSTTGDKLTAAKKLIAFINSSKGCDIQNSAGVPAGPFAISSCKVPVERSRPRRGRAEVPERQEDRAGARVHLADQGPEPREDPHPGRLGHHEGPGRRRPLRQRREGAGPAARTQGLVTDTGMTRLRA